MAKKKRRQQYQGEFLRALEHLNTEQAQAVAQIEGPVLVLAGPGTGKTHILSARIGRILLDTDTQANNILCLTFTDAGVAAMRQRLLRFIGPEAYRVPIYTFHSFCNTIIQDNLERFGRHDLEPLSDLERVEIVRRLIDDLPSNHLLKLRRSDLYFYEKQLYDLFKRMKSEAWTVDFVQERIAHYVEDLPRRKEFVYQQNSRGNLKGSPKTARIEAAREKMARLSAAVALFPRFHELLLQYRRYDFEDMILWVLDAFEEDEALLRTYQEQFLYFLIDEYQDTNGSQNRIIQQLVRYWANPNLFIVGDDDQSIYEFQGARLKNLMDFYHDYQSDLQLVLLKDNYRSSQHLLDAAQALIGQNEHRLIQQLPKLQKHLVARHPNFARSEVRPQLVVYPNRIHEDTDIAAQVTALRDRGVSLDEVAIIYAKHQQAANLVQLLEKKGIPYNTKRQVNVLDLPLIIQLRQLLEYLHAERQSPYSGEAQLFPILHFSFLGIEARALAQLSLYQAKQDYQQRPAWRDLIGGEKLLHSLGIRQPEPLLRFSELLETLLTEGSNDPLPLLVERLVNRSGMLRQVLNDPDRSWLLQQLHTFSEFVKRETDRRPRLRLPGFVETLQRMDANRLPVRLQKSIRAGEGVHLLTAHSSKGLEFRYVFLLDCTAKSWEPRRTNAQRFTFPDTLTLSGEEDAMEARRRLFYVAMTRAKEFLHLSYSQRDTRGKAINPCRFVQEIQEGTDLRGELRQLADAPLLEAQVLLLKEQRKPFVPRLDRDQVALLLEDFALSISSLNQFLRCPLSFFYEHILRVPTVSSPSAAFGTAMHFALRRLFDRWQQAPEAERPDVDAFVGFYVEELYRQEGFFTATEFRHRLDLGRQFLRRYYQQHEAGWTVAAQVEQSFRHLEIDGVPVVGTIDKLDLSMEKKAVIVDYKTGSHVAKKVRGPRPSEPLGGIYWRQLHFYKLLYEAQQKQRSVETGVISYLEPDAKGYFPEVRVGLDREGQDLLRRLIRETYQKILAQEFYEGCGEKSCPWCSFVQHNIPQDSFSDREVEALDD
ncbi:MAG: ATP-dependent DNA helicase [Bacteroidota bacterium]